MKTTKHDLVTYLALDVGEKRIGYATGDTDTKFPVPIGWFDVDGSEVQAILDFIRNNEISAVVVGFPRNLEGDKTAQTTYSEQFGQLLAERGIVTYYQDESLTSVKAEEFLRASKKSYQKGDVDAHAAAIILADFLESRY